LARKETGHEQASPVGARGPSHRSLLIALAAAAASAEAAGPGTVDTCFGTGGKVLTSLAAVNQAGNQALVSDAALRPEGDI
jgi:hypothetical protein